MEILIHIRYEDTYFWHFFQHMLVIQGAFIVTFPYMYTMYLSQSHPLHHCPSPPHPYLKIIPVTFIALFSYIDLFPHLHPSSSFQHPAPNRTCFLLQSFIFQLYIPCSKGVHHDISSMNISYFNRVNHLYYSPLPQGPINQHPSVEDYYF